LVRACSAQGGFAYCYLFTYKARHMILAGKVVSKDSLTKERAKQKVGGLGAV
jgi:hypothetical protein